MWNGVMMGENAIEKWFVWHIVAMKLQFIKKIPEKCNKWISIKQGMHVF